MNSDQIGGIIRAAMAIFAGWAVAHGFTEATWLATTGGVVAVATAIWSWYSNSTTALVAAVAKAPEVDKVLVRTPALVDAVPSPKVKMAK